MNLFVPHVLPMYSSEAREFMRQNDIGELPTMVSLSFREYKERFFAMSGETQAEIARVTHRWNLKPIQIGFTITNLHNAVYLNGDSYDETCNRLMRVSLALADQTLEQIGPGPLQDRKFHALVGTTIRAIIGCSVMKEQRGEVFDYASPKGLRIVQGMVVFSEVTCHKYLADKTMINRDGNEMKYLVVPNPKLANFLLSNPSKAARIGEFMVERGLSESEDNAQFAIDHVTGALAPALVGGGL